MKKLDEFTSRGYLGNKFKLLPFIETCLKKYRVKEVRVVADLFCGTGIVSHMFANRHGVERIISNDTEVYATMMTKARLSNESENAVNKRIERYTKRAEALVSDPTFIGGTLTSLYARPSRPIFTKDHAMMLDALSRNIHSTRPKDTSCIASLMDAALHVNNGFGHFHSAPITPRRRHVDLRMRPIHPRGSGACRVDVIRGEATDIFDDHRLMGSSIVDLVYIDPPYTKAGTYGHSYHVLNTIALNDSPEVSGNFNIRKDAYRSPFTKKSTAYDAFRKVVSVCVPRCRYICISYSTTGILKVQDIITILNQLGFSKIRVYSTTLPAYRGGAYTELVILATSPLHLKEIQLLNHRP